MLCSALQSSQLWQGWSCPGPSAGHLLVLALTLGGTILDAEAVVAHHRRSVGRAERFVADSTEILAVQRPLLEPANLSVRHAVTFVNIFVRGHVL